MKEEMIEICYEGGTFLVNPYVPLKDVEIVAKCLNDIEEIIQEKNTARFYPIYRIPFSNN